MQRWHSRVANSLSHSHTFCLCLSLPHSRPFSSTCKHWFLHASPLHALLIWNIQKLFYGNFSLYESVFFLTGENHLLFWRNTVNQYQHQWNKIELEIWEKNRANRTGGAKLFFMKPRGDRHMSIASSPKAQLVAIEITRKISPHFFWSAFERAEGCSLLPGASQ